MLKGYIQKALIDWYQREKVIEPPSPAYLLCTINHPKGLALELKLVQFYSSLGEPILFRRCPGLPHDTTLCRLETRLNNLVIGKARHRRTFLILLKEHYYD